MSLSALEKTSNQRETKKVKARVIASMGQTKKHSLNVNYFFMYIFIHPVSNFWIGQVSVRMGWVTMWSYQNDLVGGVYWNDILWDSCWWVVIAWGLNYWGKGVFDCIQTNSNSVSKSLLADFNETTSFAQKELYHWFCYNAVQCLSTVYLTSIDMEDKICVVW